MKQFATALCLGLGLFGSATAQKHVSHYGRINYYQVLNVDHNIGLRHVDGTLKGLKYSRDVYDWGDLVRFKYFTAEVYAKDDGTTVLKWWVNDNEYKKLVAKNEDKTFALSDSEIGEYPGDGLNDRFHIRRASVTDNHGGRPAYLTTKFGDNECALKYNDPGSEIYSKTTMTCFKDASELSTWNRFYLARNVPFNNEGEVWDWAKPDSTYYFINMWSRDALTTEKNEHHDIGRSGEWGDAGRFSIVPRDKPFFDLYSYSKKTRDSTPEDSDFRVRTDNHELTIAVGGTIGWKFGGKVDGRWAYFKNSVDGKKLYYQNDNGRIRDTGTGDGAQDKWEMLRVWNDAATRARSNAEDL